MAYDKVVDSSALNANLTAVANAIREKAGSTGSLSFPAGFVEAIANIAAGGGTPVGVSAIATGEYIPSANVTSSFKITHNMGKRPNVMVIVAKTALTAAESLFAAITVVKAIGQSDDYNGYYASLTGSNVAGSSPSAKSAGYRYAAANNNFTTTTALLNSAKHTLIAGHVYFWATLRVDGIE